MLRTPSVEFNYDPDDPPPVDTSEVWPNPSLDAGPIRPGRSPHWTLDKLDMLAELGGVSRLLPPDFPEDASPQEVIDAVNRRQRSSGLPQDVIERILDVMRVPDGGRRLLAEEYLDVTVTATLNVHSYLSMDFYAKTTRAQINRVAESAEQLREALSQLDAVAYESLTEALLGYSGPAELFAKQRLFETPPVEVCKRLVQKITICAELVSMPKPKSDPHRPQGSLKHPAFHFLLRDLRRLIVEEAGGSLTYRVVDGRLKGTAPIVLEILRPYLPGVIPHKLSYSSIRRALLRKARPDGPCS
jgi:hypothetical protein